MPNREVSGGSLDSQINTGDSVARQLLHLVMGGRVTDPQGIEFADLKDVDLVGIYPSYAEAEDAWRAQAQRTRR